MVSPAKSKWLPEVFWGTLSQEQKKKSALGLKARCRWLEAPTSRTVFQKNSSQQPHSPGRASIHGLCGAQTRASPAHTEPHGVSKLGHRDQSLPTHCWTSQWPGNMNWEAFVHRHLCFEQSYISAGWFSPLPAQAPFTPLGLFSHFISKTECLTWSQPRKGMAQLPSRLQCPRVRVFCQLDRLLPLETEQIME